MASQTTPATGSGPSGGSSVCSLIVLSRSLIVVATALLVACSPSPQSPPTEADHTPGDTKTPHTSADRDMADVAPQSPQTAAESGPDHYEFVRVDPETFEEEHLGRAFFDASPPYLAKVLDGDLEMLVLVDAMNDLPHAVAAGGKVIPRTDKSFLRIMKNTWLRNERGVTLREPTAATSPPARFQLAKWDGGAYQTLGTVELDDKHYLRVVGGPRPSRAALGAVTTKANAKSFTVDIPPPDGKRGRWGRRVDRGTPEHLTMLRDHLLERGHVLVAGGTTLAPASAVETREGKRGPWLSVHVPRGYSSAAATPEVPMHLSSPPGGPAGVRILRYNAGVEYDAASLEAYVTAREGKRPGFATGTVGEIEIATRRLLGMTFQTGTSLARADHLLVLWPRRNSLGTPRDTGFAVEVTVGAAEGAPIAEPAQILEHPPIATIARSLFIDPNSAH